jgi:hypothetical protein
VVFVCAIQQQRANLSQFAQCTLGSTASATAISLAALPQVEFLLLAPRAFRTKHLKILFVSIAHCATPIM